MKVLQVINTLDTGGAEKLLLETIPLFNKKGIETDLLVFEKAEGIYLKELQKLKCCKILSLNSYSLYNPINILKIIPFLKSYDIVHVHLFPALYWVAFAKIISFSDSRLLFTEHSTFNKRRSNFILKWLDKLTYRKYRKIICISKCVKNELERIYSFPSNKLLVIENGIDLKKFQNAVALKKSDIHHLISENDKLLVIVSKFRAEKDQVTVIKSMLHLPEYFKLILVGEGPLKIDCQRLVNKLNLDHRVFFLGNRNDVESIYKTSDVSIVSSHWEGFGLVAVEGMAVGKPVIASKVPGLSEIVSGAGLLFEKGNEFELAKIINDLMCDSSQNIFNEISNNCIIRAKEFDIHKMVHQTIILYSSLTNLVHGKR